MRSKTKKVESSAFSLVLEMVTMIPGSALGHVNTSRMLPWVGWNSGQLSFVLIPAEKYGRRTSQATGASRDMFVEVTRLWWERFAASGDWVSAAALGKKCAEDRPDLAYGWENWAWALHKLGQTEKAYKTLAPILKKLKVHGPPSGRAAYCLACFCGTLGKNAEGVRWLKLAHAMAVDKDTFRVHAVHDPDLRDIWPGLPRFAEAALSVLE